MSFVRNAKILVVSALILLFGIIIIKPYYSFLKRDLKISLLQTLFLPGNIRKVNNQTNIVILGIPGGRHDGPNLSDSITVVNYDFKKNRTISIGIPRDIWSDALQDRINTAYAYGQVKAQNKGLILAKAEIGMIIGFPIQYGAVIDFSQFKDLIDLLGGVDVSVERSFIDKKFPKEGKENDECGGDPEFKCRYETVRFTKGEQHMDGATTLKFVRSRNAEGAEGSDFSRSKRQQIVADSVKGKIFGALKSLQLGKMRKLYASADKSVIRDISNQQFTHLLKRMFFKRNFYQKNFILSRELFEIPGAINYDGKYVLIPKENDSKKIRTYILCLLETEDEKGCLKNK
ncbi:LCP family protein [Candidatus Roizmanbacteria bacterium]|nr:LCP family protein [Candidatus Roizmanbacteria bacterium]